MSTREMAVVYGVSYQTMVKRLKMARSILLMKWQEQQQQGLQNSSLLWMLRDTIKERPDLKEDIDAFLEKLNKQDIKK